MPKDDNDKSWESLYPREPAPPLAEYGLHALRRRFVERLKQEAAELLFPRNPPLGADPRTEHWAERMYRAAWINGLWTAQEYERNMERLGHPGAKEAAEQEVLAWWC